MINKYKSRMFGKEIYLLGTDSEGTKYFLESPSWDCGWYWGFGYIETYTNNRCIELSRDISSHQHADNFYSKWCEGILVNKTFDDSEKWALCELFQNFYTLRNLADAQHSNGKEGNFTSVNHGFNYKNLIKEGLNINKDCIPFVMAKIISILSPVGETVEELEQKYKNMIKEA